MTEVKLTKTELKDQRYKLSQLEKYLPTLQLKKSMLQTEVNNTIYEIEQLNKKFLNQKAICEEFQVLLSQPQTETIKKYVKVGSISKNYENIAGAEIPSLKEVLFPQLDYSLYNTPFWIDAGIIKLKGLVLIEQEITVVEEKKAILEKELREVSIRVNLFEKILIPRTTANIKKIKIFLGDQELAAVAQAKVAKSKILQKKKQEELE